MNATDYAAEKAIDNARRSGGPWTAEEVETARAAGVPVHVVHQLGAKLVQEPSVMDIDVGDEGLGPRTVDDMLRDLGVL